MAWRPEASTAVGPPEPPRILVINPNSTTALTDRYATEVTSALRLLGITPVVDGLTGTGPAAIESNAEALVACASVLPQLAAMDNGYSFGIFAAFGDPGREALQEVASFPVLGITEAAAMIGQTAGAGYGVLTTMPAAVRQIEYLLAGADLGGHCAGVLASGVSVLALQHPEPVMPQLVRTARALLEGGRCDVICLGCAAMTGLEDGLSAHLGVPVVDGVKAAVGIGLGLLSSAGTAGMGSVPMSDRGARISSQPADLATEQNGARR